MGAMRSPGDALIARLAVEQGLLSPEQLAGCLGEGNGGPLEAVLVRRGILREEEVGRLLEEGRRRLEEGRDVSDPRLEDALFARLLLRLGLAGEVPLQECLRAQVDLAQRGEAVPRLGELLVRRGYLPPGLSDAALLLRRETVYVCPSCRSRFSAEGTEAGKKYPCRDCGCILERREEVRPAGEEKAAARLDVPEDAVEASRDPSRWFADGRYLLIREVGRGGMGVVWKAWQTDLRRYVALKLLVGTMWTEVELKRFYREAQMAAGLSHANIASIYEVGAHGGKHFIAMEFVDGESLAQLMASPARPGTARGARGLPPRRAIEIVRDAALAVDYAHSKRILHRDLKPHNIMVQRRDGRVYVMDFGLAKPFKTPDSITVSDTIVGTPPYMSPEQGRGEPLDRRSDVYSLGAVLYHALTGRPPFEARSPAETLMAVLGDDPVPPRRLNPRLHADVETICLKALEKDRHRRYDSARSFAEDLTRYLEGEPIGARPLSAWERSWRAVRRHPALSALAAASVGAALLVSVVWGSLRLQARARADTFHRQALEAWGQEQYAEAVSCCEKALALVPDHPEALFLMDRCAEQIRRRAREHEREARAREQEIQRLRSTADSLFEAGLFDKALSQYAEILRLDPEDEQAQRRKASCDVEMDRLSLIRAEQAKLARETEGAYQELLRTEELRQKKRARATPHYDRARRAVNDAARMRVREAGGYTVQEVLEKYRAAREALTRALREDDTYTEAWCFRGEVRHKMGDYVLAERDYQEALRLNREFSPAAFGSAMTQLSLFLTHHYTPYLRDLRSRDAAFVRLGEAARQVWQSPDPFEHACGIALQHFQRGAYAPAADTMTSVRAEGRGNYFYHLLTAAILAADRRSDEALRELSAALDLNPIALEALYLRAVLRARGGDLQGALADAERAAESAPPENWTAPLLQGWVCSSLGRKEEARRHLERAAAAPGAPAAEIRHLLEGGP